MAWAYLIRQLEVPTCGVGPAPLRNSQANGGRQSTFSLQGSPQDEKNSIIHC